MLICNYISLVYSRTLTLSIDESAYRSHRKYLNVERRKASGMHDRRELPSSVINNDAAVR